MGDHDPEGFAAVVAVILGLGKPPALRIKVFRMELAQREGERVTDPPWLGTNPTPMRRIFPNPKAGYPEIRLCVR